MVTVDFTAPKKVADDANLALYFKACFTECDEFYALLAKFVVMPSTPAGTSFRNGPVSGAWNRVFPPAGFCCNDATLFVFTPGGSPRDDEERFAASLVSLQVATTDLKDGRAQFQIVIEGRPGAGADVRWIEQTLRLTWLVNTSIGSEFSEFEPSAGGVSKIAVSRKDATITVDFTAPKEMIDDPRLALSFIPGYFGAGIDPDGGLFQFYASPAAFRSGEAPARTKD
jgi:hypothetical protein